MPIADQIPAYRRLQHDAATLGIRVYPLDGESLYLVAPGGFALRAVSLDAAIAAVRQARSARE